MRWINRTPINGASAARVRLTCVGTIDAEIEREIINKGGQTT